MTWSRNVVLAQQAALLGVKGGVPILGIEVDICAVAIQSLHLSLHMSSNHWICMAFFFKLRVICTTVSYLLSNKLGFQQYLDIDV